MAETIHEQVRHAYEAIAYVGRPFHETHPNRLLAVAQLHGVKPPGRELVSVLEIGSGTAEHATYFAGAMPWLR